VEKPIHDFMIRMGFATALSIHATICQRSLDGLFDIFGGVFFSLPERLLSIINSYSIRPNELPERRYTPVV